MNAIFCIYMRIVNSVCPLHTYNSRQQQCLYAYASFLSCVPCSRQEKEHTTVRAAAAAPCRIFLVKRIVVVVVEVVRLVKRVVHCAQ